MVLVIAEQILQRAKAFCSFHAARLGRWLGHPGGLEDIQPGQVTLTDQRDIQHPITSCSVCKSEERKRNGGTFGAMVLTVWTGSHQIWGHLSPSPKTKSV